MEYYNKLEDPTDEEAFGLSETSRLGCQIVARPKLDGIRLAIPTATRNSAVDGDYGGDVAVLSKLMVSGDHHLHGLKEQLLSFLQENEGVDSFLLKKAKKGLGLIVRGLDKKVQKLINNFKDIQAVLEDAERRQLKEASVRQRDAETQPLLKKVRYSISSYSAHIIQHLGIAQKIDDLNERLDVIALEKEVCGRDGAKRTLVNLLLSENTSVEEESSFPVISVVGMGGIEKTTLAQLVFHAPEIKSHFDERFWVFVSDPFDNIKIAKAVLESIRNEAPNIVELETLSQNVREFVSGRNILLVLDDCKGLPLAAKVLGGLMRFKRTEEQWQIFPKDKDICKDELIKLWMAQCYLPGTESLNVANELELSVKAHHLSLTCAEGDVNVPECIHRAKKLRSLLIERASSYGHLIDCSALEELPSGIGKLSNLKHLRNGGTRKVKSMPNGMGRLTCLRTLDVFVADGSTTDFGELGRPDETPSRAS
ncbi:Disease resistance protein [Corchorus olitorius]|uniref:Disease resistance protein n=1 Tax=Corchorus olitorius TaxID=93759 RepID=A0A1R3HV72_9ROSI|nr:Disease resistance protein [Corchorus olitorius]